MLSESAREIGELLDCAIRESGVSRYAVADDLGMGEAQVSRWCSGDAHQMLDRLLRVDPCVLRSLASALAMRCGVVVVPDALLDSMAQLCEAVGGRRLAKAALAGHAQRRTA